MSLKRERSPVPETVGHLKKHHGDFHLLRIEEEGPVQMGFWVANRVWATVEFLIPFRNALRDKRRQHQIEHNHHHHHHHHDHNHQHQHVPLHPEVSLLRSWVLERPVYRMRICSMIEEANAFIASLDENVVRDIHDQDGDCVWLDDFDFFFEALSDVISVSPSFSVTPMVGTPLNGLLAVAMATRSGEALFHDASFNQMLKNVLQAFHAYLNSEQSLDKLDIHNPEKKGSWISKKAHEAGVWHEMQHDPNQQHYGFKSWNDFFLRQFIDGARPFVGDEDVVVNIGCETTPWRYDHDLKLRSRFWIKDMPYSLVDLFGGREDMASLFEGGCLYQGFLSATHYHRWRCPASGHLLKSFIVNGTYFAQRPQQGEQKGTWEGTESQPYLGHVATRAIFLMRHAQCGLIAMLCIGMVEVSTCHIDHHYHVGENNQNPLPIKRDTEIGRFEFGGSTHILIFQRNAVDLADWAIHAKQHRNDPQPIKMGSILATPKKK